MEILPDDDKFGYWPDLDAIYAEVSRLNDDGILTIRQAISPGYYRLRNGEYAGRIVMLVPGLTVDNKSICLFSHGTWVYRSKIEDVLCEATSPTFSPGKFPVLKPGA